MSRIGKINAIQGLRGIAALLVVADHSLLRFSQRTAADRVDTSLIHLAEILGRHGVEIFFLISGFVMTITSFDDFGKPRASPRFLWRRIIRIVPLYWLITLLVVAGLIWRARVPELAKVVKSLAFIPYENESGLFQPLLSRGWTLNYEMFFYALFALALFQKPSRGLIAVVATLLALTLLGPLLLDGGCGAPACRFASFYVQPIMLYFAGGILLGAIRLFFQHRDAVPVVPFDNGIGIAIVLTGIYVVYVSTAEASSLTYVVGVIFCVLATAVCALLEDRTEHGAVRALLLAVGEASYSIYMTHTLIVDPVSRLWSEAFGRQWLGPYLAVEILGASLLGMLTFRCVEKPVLRAFRRSH
jgi:peptidoglycan/LPS O-acetylase OafA/YrhL